ncbi:hypothetical protein Rumeso_03011 [Rubellimicrobium mesophilum DSM 19309]|uniref:Uncharacterized protein n=1 Tax=Rubellimicrobium mesophilum DSM 19309 TaxID=442562 RepID=A0A017HM58_9RHOB|nr:hypothetical protein Rumeso_03011 [Rubellimicrobium mesophilum DSM 19309]
MGDDAATARGSGAAFRAPDRRRRTRARGGPATSARPGGLGLVSGTCRLLVCALIPRRAAGRKGPRASQVSDGKRVRPKCARTLQGVCRESCFFEAERSICRRIWGFCVIPERSTGKAGPQTPCAERLRDGARPDRFCRRIRASGAYRSPASRRPWQDPGLGARPCVAVGRFRARSGAWVGSWPCLPAPWRPGTPGSAARRRTRAVRSASRRSPSGTTASPTWRPARGMAPAAPVARRSAIRS